MRPNSVRALIVIEVVALVTIVFSVVSLNPSITGAFIHDSLSTEALEVNVYGNVAEVMAVFDWKSETREPASLSLKIIGPDGEVEWFPETTERFLISPGLNPYSMYIELPEDVGGTYTAFLTVEISSVKEAVSRTFSL